MIQKLVRGGLLIVVILLLWEFAINWALPSGLEAGVSYANHLTTSVKPLDFHLPTPTPHP